MGKGRTFDLDDARRRRQEGDPTCEPNGGARCPRQSAHGHANGRHAPGDRNTSACMLIWGAMEGWTMAPP